MLCLTLLNTGNPRIHVHETAVQLLHLLYKRFFLDDVIATGGEQADVGGDDSTLLWHSSQQLSKLKLQEMLLTGPDSRSQYCLSETLARLHPQETMLIFSEVTKRVNTATHAVRQSLLQLLLPWLHNLELCDPNLQNSGSTNHPPESGTRRPLIHRGRASPLFSPHHHQSYVPTSPQSLHLYYLPIKYHGLVIRQNQIRPFRDLPESNTALLSTAS